VEEPLEMEEQLEEVARPCCCPGRYFMRSSRGRALQGVTEETLIAVGVAARLVIIFWRSWGGGELETGRHLQGYGVSSPSCGGRW